MVIIISDETKVLSIFPLYIQRPSLIRMKLIESTHMAPSCNGWFYSNCLWPRLMPTITVRNVVLGPLWSWETHIESIIWHQRNVPHSDSRVKRWDNFIESDRNGGSVVKICAPPINSNELKLTDLFCNYVLENFIINASFSAILYLQYIFHTL